MITNYTITGVYVGAASASSMYLGANQVWPPNTPSAAFWYNITSGVCISITTNSSSNITNGLNWNDGSSTTVAVGTNTYQHCYTGAIVVSNSSCTGGAYSINVSNFSSVFTWNGNEQVLNTGIMSNLSGYQGSKIMNYAGGNSTQPSYLSPYPYPLNAQFDCVTVGQYSFVYTYEGNDWIMRRNNAANTWVAVGYLYDGSKNGDSYGFSNSTNSALVFGLNSSVTGCWDKFLLPDSSYNNISNIVLFPDP